MLKRVYSPNSDWGIIGGESHCRYDYKKKFIQLICKLVLEKLKTGGTIVNSLLESAIEKETEKMLDDYLHSQLDIIMEKFNKKYKLECTVRHDYATYDKLDAIFDYIDALEKEIKNQAEQNERI